jgi:hypothetical protein
MQRRPADGVIGGTSLLDSLANSTRARAWRYLRAVWTDVKVALRLEPRLETTVMMATEIPAAIRQYSMAVAPLSSPH